MIAKNEIILYCDCERGSHIFSKDSRLVGIVNSIAQFVKCPECDKNLMTILRADYCAKLNEQKKLRESPPRKAIVHKNGNIVHVHVPEIVCDDCVLDKTVNCPIHDTPLDHDDEGDFCDLCDIEECTTNILARIIRNTIEGKPIFENVDGKPLENDER